jgi:quercetin dioxygenase-like cupin family protein
VRPGRISDDFSLEVSLATTERTPSLTTQDAAGPEKLLASVAYQTGAVVSRTILKKETGNVTVFAFDEGEGLSEHTTPHDAMVQVLDGRVDISIGGKDYSLEGGEWMVMPANVPHSLKAAGRFKMLLTMITS